MNNHYNEIALRQIGRWIDTTIYFLFKENPLLGILILVLFVYFFYKFWNRPIR